MGKFSKREVKWRMSKLIYRKLFKGLVIDSSLLQIISSIWINNYWPCWVTWSTEISNVRFYKSVLTLNESIFFPTNAIHVFQMNSHVCVDDPRLFSKLRLFFLTSTNRDHQRETWPFHWPELPKEKQERRKEGSHQILSSNLSRTRGNNCLSATF